MKKLILFVFIILACSLVFADEQDLNEWAENYVELVELLRNTSEVGDCRVSLSSDPSLPEEGWMVNFLQNSNGLIAFTIIPPSTTDAGRIKVEKVSDNEDILKYSQADFVGWVNMIVSLKDGYITGIELNKTLPNGTVYNQGLKCGSL